jgi:hypothetical protein
METPSQSKLKQTVGLLITSLLGREGRGDRRCHRPPQLNACQQSVFGRMLGFDATVVTYFSLVPTKVTIGKARSFEM